MAPRHQAVIPDADGDWTVFLPSRGKSRRRKLPQTESTKPQPWTPTDTEFNCEREVKLQQDMQICIKKLENSNFYRTFLEKMQTHEILDSFSRVLASEPKMQMVIYGIGSIESSQFSRLQLALAILLKRKFDWIGDIEVFDPIISTTESAVLEFLGCSVLLVNEEGRRQAVKPTLFFMPHCEAFLYENVLAANWRAHHLNQMVIFGNCFDLYEQYNSLYQNSIVSESAKRILSVRRFSTEEWIWRNYSRFNCRAIFLGNLSFPSSTMNLKL